MTRPCPSWCADRALSVQDSGMGNEATVATVFKPLLRTALGPTPTVRFAFWDGSTLGPEGDYPGTIRVRSRDALGHLVWAPGELGLGRAYVSGELDLDGDIFKVLRALQHNNPNDARLGLDAAWKALGVAGRPGAPPPRPRPPTQGAPPR